MDGRVEAAYKAKGHSFACFDTCPLYAATTSGDELGMLGAWQFACAHVAASSSAASADPSAEL
jgi:hypothetical protein